MTYKISNGLVKYGATVILDNINFEIRGTEKVAVIGRNGCGKTTLLKLISGMITLDNLDSDEDSYIVTDGKPSIGYLQQMSFSDETITVEEEIMKVYAPVIALTLKLEDLLKQMETDCSDRVLKEYAEAQEKLELMGGYDYKKDIDIIFTKFGFELLDLQRPISTFSGGQKTKIAFVKLLLSKPDIMLLDEPTNHLDMPTIEWLEGYLKLYPKAVVIVSHDRMFLDKVVDVTYEIEYNNMKRYPGNYTAFLERKRLNWEKQAKDYLEQKREIERLTTIVEKYKNTPTKVAMTRSKLKQIEHMDKIDAPDRYDTSTFHVNLTPIVEGGKDVLQIKKLQIGYDRVLSEVSIDVKRGQKMAVIGENGIGKSTLLKTLIGQIEPLGGSYSYGLQIETGYYDQELAGYSSDKTVIDDYWDEYPDLKQTEVRTALGSFLFTKDDVFKSVNQLSGGEKVRLYMAKLFRKRPNFLILDEPTNHMDLVGKETLEKMLKSYTGTVLCVSHDRYFIKEIADSLLVFNKDKVTYYPYRYDEYIAQNRGEQAVAETKKINLVSSPSQRNPGKEIAKKEQKVRRLEQQIEEHEIKIEALRNEMSLPENAMDYIKLFELQSALDEEEDQLEQIMEEWTMIS
ncbi:MAG: transporter related [Herbinix sp.]|jgi:ATP-binding cassette subfamily F protein 3|nr:transporter related [Herbinix sp.]